ncbi:MAG TPA: hypothetical protein VFM46_06385 [Pseudomonadales bacterium]|nr:hypothetical protein [Pseudomonadales bacterium]
MNIIYRFVLEKGELVYETDVDRRYDPQQLPADLPEWTRLEYSQCENCPLNKLDHPHCPAAVDLRTVVTDFKNLPAIEKADVYVATPERSYYKKVELEEGVRSLMGLIMASSACPILSTLKPNARNHLPFASRSEFIIRSVSLFLLRQYFLYREGYRPDWELQGLIKLNQELNMLNQAFWRRIHDACESDSNLQALLSFFDLSSTVSYSLEAQLKKISPMFLGEEADLAPPPNSFL